MPGSLSNAGGMGWRTGGSMDRKLKQNGRWPANVVLDEEAGEMLDAQSGITTSSGGRIGNKDGASRFFYCAKASKKERFSFLRCDCETVKLESWQKQDPNPVAPTAGTSQQKATSGEPLTDGSSSSTSTYGNEPTGQSQAAIPFTTEMETNRTTDSKISSSSPPPSTSACTPGAKSETESGENHASSAERSIPSPQSTGTSPPKDTPSTGVVADATSAALYRGSVCVDCGAEVKSEGHPTQKPVALMRWLVRLTTPPGGIVLDPFMGSGSTGVAALAEGMDFVGIEQSEEYVAIAKSRLDKTPTGADDVS